VTGISWGEEIVTTAIVRIYRDTGGPYVKLNQAMYARNEANYD
jgi:hypothetical protein